MTFKNRIKVYDWLLIVQIPCIFLAIKTKKKSSLIILILSSDLNQPKTTRRLSVLCSIAIVLLIIVCRHQHTEPEQVRLRSYDRVSVPSEWALGRASESVGVCFLTELFLLWLSSFRAWLPLRGAVSINGWTDLEKNIISLLFYVYFEDVFPRCITDNKIL